MSTTSSTPDEPTSSDDPPRRAWWRRPRVIAMSATAVALVGIVAVVLALRPADMTPAASGSTSASPIDTSAPTGSASPDPTPAASASPSAAAPDPLFPELDPVAPTEPGEAAVHYRGLVFEIIKVEHVTGEVVAPGDVAAPAVRLTIRATNGTSEPFALDYTVVNGYTGPERTPRESYDKPGALPFTGTIDVGGTATGVFVLRVPEELRTDLTVVVDFLVGESAVVFQGDFSQPRG